MVKRYMMAACAALALAGCGGAVEAETPAADAVTETAPADAAAPAAAVNAGDKPSKEFVVGKWGEDGDCTLAIDFRPDGTTDGPFGDWTLEDGVLSMGDAPQKMHVTVIDDNTMESRLDGTGDPKRMTRC